MFRILILLLPMLTSVVMQVAPVRAQDTRIRIQDDGTTQGASNILNCTGGLGCTVADGVAVLAGGAGEGGGMADPGANGIVKRVGPNITLPAVAGTDYVVPGGSITGNAATATALATNPNDCSATQFATTIAANGNLTCAALTDADIPNTITVDQATAATTATTATTAAALTSNPTDCSATQFATTIAANGNLTCAALTDADIPDTITASNYQPLDSDLTTLAGKTLFGTEDSLATIASGSTAGRCVQIKAGGGLEAAAAACGTGSGGGGSGDALTTAPLSQFAPTTSAEFAGVITNETGTGAVVLATNPVLVTPNLGSPSAIDLANATGLPITTGLSGLGTGVAAFLTTPSNANFVAALTGESGTGTVVLNTDPTLSGATLNGVTLGGTVAAASPSTVDLSLATSTKLFATAAAAAPTADNDCQWDSTAHRLKCGENGTTQTVAWTADAPLNNITVGAPTAADDATEGFSIFSRWIDTSTTPDTAYVALDVTADAAVWAVDTDTIQPTPTWQAVVNQGRNITDATSVASRVCIGADDGDGNYNEAGEGGTCWYTDAAEGPIQQFIPDENRFVEVPSTFAMIWRYAGAEYMRLSSTGLSFANAGRPSQEIEVQGYEFGACTYAEAAITASKPKLGLLTCTDSDSDGFDFDFKLPADAVVGTDMLTVQLSAMHVGASPSNTLELDCSGQAVSDGDVIADKVTTGEKPVSISFSGATQYSEQVATSTAITINGTPAAGDHIYMHCDIDKDATTITTMSNIRIIPVAKVTYLKTKP